MRYRNLQRSLERVNPSVWLFFVALLALFIGLGIPAFKLLAMVGGFIIAVYLVIILVGILLGLKEI